MSSSPLWQTPILDEAVNHHWALEVARGEGWGELPFFRAPLYPWLLGLVYGVVGESPAGARLVQAVLSSFTCLLAWWIARRTFSPLAGWCAGVLAATYWPWVYFDAELQDVPLGLFCNLAALAVLVTWTPRRRHGWLAAAAGLLLGLSAITRPTVLVVVPLVAGWLWWQAGRDDVVPSPRPWWAPALLAAGVAVAVLPVTALNRMVGGDSVLVASQGGHELLRRQPSRLRWALGALSRRPRRLGARCGASRAARPSVPGARHCGRRRCRTTGTDGAWSSGADEPASALAAHGAQGGLPGRRRRASQQQADPVSHRALRSGLAPGRGRASRWWRRWAWWDCGGAAAAGDRFFWGPSP